MAYNKRGKKMKNYHARAVYVSQWDGGETTIESKCVVDLAERRIIRISNKREIYGPYSEDEVDGAVECLDRQYIVFPNGVEYPVVESGYMDGYETCGKEEKIPFEL